MSWHREDHTIAISGGAGSFVSDHPWRGTLINIIAEPDSVTNEYILTVTDRKGDNVIVFGTIAPVADDPQVGNLNSALEMPVLGLYTFTISPADSAGTIDENIRIRTTCSDTDNY